MRRFVLAVVLLMSGPVAAQGWTEPARGSATRAALMDAIRPQAEWMLGAPVEFMVWDLRVSGDLAFASVTPQRPGGTPIDPWSTPAYHRGEIYPDDMEGVNIQALYVLSGQTWVAVHWVMGATDVWYAYGPICTVWRRVIPEACQGL